MVRGVQGVNGKPARTVDGLVHHERKARMRGGGLAFPGDPIAVCRLTRTTFEGGTYAGGHMVLQKCRPPHGQGGRGTDGYVYTGYIITVR